MKLIKYTWHPVPILIQKSNKDKGDLDHMHPVVTSLNVSQSWLVYLQLLSYLLPDGIFFLKGLFSLEFSIEKPLQTGHLNKLQQEYPHNYPQLVDNFCGFPNSSEEECQPINFDRDNNHL